MIQVTNDTLDVNDDDSHDQCVPVTIPYNW